MPITDATHKENIQFKTARGHINGWFFHPKSAVEKPVACIIMAHGYGATKEMGLENYAIAFANAGMAALVFDYSALSANADKTYQHVDPFQQIEDYRDAITYAASRNEVDAEKIGVWGSSFSGGHALVVSATDKRVKCVVAQVPTIDGYESFMRRKSAEQVAELNQQFAQERQSRLAGNPPQTRTLVANDLAQNPVYSNPAAVAWYTSFGDANPHWKNSVTLESMELFRAYKPGSYISNIAPCPLMIVVAEEDIITPVDLALEAFAQAGEPKRVVTLPGDHFEPYNTYFSLASTAACEWFIQHL